MLDVVLCGVLSAILAVGGVFGYAKKGSTASLIAGVLFAAVYLGLAFCMVRPVSLSGAVHHVRYRDENRRRCNALAAAVGGSLALVFAIRVLFFGASLMMGLGVGGLGVLSLAIHGIHSKL